MSEKSISSGATKNISIPSPTRPGPIDKVLVYVVPEEHALVKEVINDKNAPAIFGSSEGAGYGVHGRSKYSAGICGEGDKENGNHAGQFNGNVEITGDLVVKGKLHKPEFTGPGQLDGDLHVNGVIHVTDNIFLSGGADFAEDFDIAEAECIEPGTVMVLGEEGVLQQSCEAYDKHVAGVISGAGEFKPGIVLDKQITQANRKPIALFGKVYCKVDASYGDIKVGDLLTSSPTPGHAMKANDPLKAFGSVIGKSLRPWSTGQGLIPILIALQ
ncbi:MAG: hypothetical protein ACXWTP_00335 [Methylosarcina sp.]